MNASHMIDIDEMTLRVRLRYEEAVGKANSELQASMHAIDVIKKLSVGDLPAIVTRKEPSPVTPAPQKKKHEVVESRPIVARQAQAVLNITQMMREVIAEIAEPFTMSDIRKKIIEGHPGIDKYKVRNTSYASMTNFESKRIVERIAGWEDQVGPIQYRRTPIFSTTPNWNGDGKPVCEPSTGREWKSVQDFLTENPKYKSAQHRVYRALKEGVPLSDGRAIQYLVKSKQLNAVAVVEPQIVPEVIESEATDSVACFSGDDDRAALGNISNQPINEDSQRTGDAISTTGSENSESTFHEAAEVG